MLNAIDNHLACCSPPRIDDSSAPDFLERMAEELHACQMVGLVLVSQIIAFFVWARAERGQYPNNIKDCYQILQSLGG